MERPLIWLGEHFVALSTGGSTRLSRPLTPVQKVSDKDYMGDFE